MTPLTPRNAPVIDDYMPDATPEERRVWERAIRAALDAALRGAAEDLINAIDAQRSRETTP